MFIRAGLKGFGLQAFAISLIASGMFPSSALANDVIADLPSISYPSKHDGDSTSQTFRMVSSAQTDSSITSITAVAPDSYVPSSVNAQATCANPMYATLCQEIKNQAEDSQTTTGWQTVYSGSGTNSIANIGNFSAWRASIKYQDYQNVAYSKTYSGVFGDKVTLVTSSTHSYCNTSVSQSLSITFSSSIGFPSSSSIEKKSYSCSGPEHGILRGILYAQIKNAYITKLEVYR